MIEPIRFCLRVPFFVALVDLRRCSQIFNTSVFEEHEIRVLLYFEGDIRFN